MEEARKKRTTIKIPGGKGRHSYEETEEQNCRECKLTAFKQNHMHKGHIAERSY